MTRRAQPLRAVVFDFDGTLLDSLTLVLQSITHALEPFGGKPTMEIFANLGGPPERFMPALVADVQHVPAAIERMGDYHERNQHLIRPFEGVEDVVRRLRAAGVSLAIWTGRDRASTERLLREHGLAAEFATVVCGDDLPSHKPDPEGLREILRRLGVAPAETVMVGDADVDVLGAAGCGVDVVLIRHARDIAAEVGAKTWRTVQTPAEAFALVLARVG